MELNRVGTRVEWTITVRPEIRRRGSSSPLDDDERESSVSQVSSRLKIV